MGAIQRRSAPSSVKHSASLAGASVISILATLAFVNPVSALTSPTYKGTLASASANAFYPSGLTFDPALNRVIVADTGLDRIDVYDSTQAIPTLVGPQHFGSVGTGKGQFQSPRAVAVDASSNIYVADAENSRIQKFDSAGNWQWTAGMPVKGVHSSLTLNIPIGISFDLANNVILVADTGHSLIRAYKPSDGTLQWSSPSPSNTGLSSPRDAYRGPDGRIWVADYQHQEVKAYNVTSAGGWTTSPAIVLGDGKANGHLQGELNAPYDARFSPDGKTVYVADTGNERVSVWTLSGTTATSQPPIGQRCGSPCLPPPPGGNLLFNDLRRVVVDPSGKLWVADFWGSGIHEIDPAGPTSVLEWYGTAAAAPGFAQAFGVGVGSDGTAYVVDRLNQRVERFDSTGAYQNSQGQRGTASGSYSWPEGVAVAPDKTVWVADTRNDRLFQFSADLGTLLLTVGTTSSGKSPAAGTFSNIDGVSVDASGNVWADDTSNNRVQEYVAGSGTPGTFKALGSRGKGTTGTAQFIAPQGIAASGSAVYVADTGNNRIVKMDSSSGGILKISAGSVGLSGPEGVAIAPDGTVWVADTQNGRIVHLDANLANLGNGFGTCGSSTPPPPSWPVCASGSTNLYLPHSLVVAGSTLFVADTYNNRVQEINIAGA